MSDLVALPPQPDGVAWPTHEWPRAQAVATVDSLVAAMFADTDRYETTYAVVVVRHGAVIAERYGGARPRWADPPEPVEPSTRLGSWSMAKSILHAAVGILAADGVVDLHAPAPVPEWQRDPSDGRAAITLEHLLEMRDGLEWFEDYLDGNESNVIHMLFGDGMADVAGYAAARPLAHAPGTVFNYSSGTSNIVARLAGDAVGGRAGMESLLHDRLFAPIGMTTATAGFDEAGTFVGSSYVEAIALDFARFGYLYLRDGHWDGRRVLPEGWVDHARLERSVDTDGWRYGAHWWVLGDEWGSFWANGYEGQSILVVPGLDAVVVRLGRTDATHSEDLRAWRAEMIQTLATSSQTTNQRDNFSV